MKKETTVSVCKNCGRDFDKKETARVFGKESSVLIGGFCSSRCFTNHEEHLNKKAMNLSLKPVFFCTTSFQTWGKGFTIDEAKKAAKVKSKSDKFVVVAAMYNDPNEAELKNLYDCIAADPMWGNAKYYDGDRTKEDDDMIKKFHVGWVTIIDNSK